MTTRETFYPLKEDLRVGDLIVQLIKLNSPHSLVTFLDGIPIQYIMEDTETGCVEIGSWVDEGDDSKEEESSENSVNEMTWPFHHCDSCGELNVNCKCSL